jgi:hypothetical protein
VVVAGEDVGHERAEHVERRAVAERALQLHVPLDLIEGHVAGALDHHLHALAPGALGELAERLELRELRGVARVGEAAGAQAVAERERSRRTWRMMSQMRPSARTWVLLAVDEHPLGQQRAAARDDADEALLHEREVRAAHARVDGEVVDALLAWCSSVSRITSAVRSSILRPMIIE